ncbi:MAG TPA: NAD-dependent epimerase/dehydratase family protein [bacterium]|nr:NAD-dependent epimerase/dehydratase family protein [bacterium]
MKMLILGGTRFVGRHIAEAAVLRGHCVTLFNRGQSDPNPTLDVERLVGNRDGDLEALRGRRWDAAVDVSGYVPRIVRASAEMLAPAVQHFTFVSTASVYAGAPGDRVDETTSTRTIEDETREDYQDPAAYGALKALCERAVERVLPNHTFIPRLSLVVGPRDPTDRFTYWPRRIARGGRILAFDRPDRVVIPFIDARDVASWVVAGVEAGRTGAFNVGGKMGVTIGEVVETCRTVARVPGAPPTWVSETFLLQHGVKPWIELPLWVPRERDDLTGLDSTRAAAQGLRLRPLANTIADTLAWDGARDPHVSPKAGLTAEREAELLRLWDSADGRRQGM